jgi:hypothetical protein
VAPPTKCPECGAKTEWEEYPEDVVAYRCLNANCEEYYARKRVKAAKFPPGCPCCKQPVEKLERGIDLYCVNPACPAQLKERLRWFCHRGQMDIEGLGEKLIDQLVDRGLLKTFADIYRLKEIADRRAGIGGRAGGQGGQANGGREGREKSLRQHRKEPRAGPGSPARGAGHPPRRHPRGARAGVPISARSTRWRRHRRKSSPR